MKKLITSIALGVVAMGVIGTQQSSAQPATYSNQDLLLFFQNPQGTVGNDRIVTYSLGNVVTGFRDAATPSNPNFGTSTALGNIGGILTTEFGANWTSGASTIFGGAAGQNGSTSAINTTVNAAGDFARTVYISKPTSFGGFAHYNPSNSAVASNIAGNSTGIFGQANPFALGIASTNINTQNPFTATNQPALAYTGIQNGVMGSLQPIFSAGGFEDVVLALNIFRVTNILTNVANSTSNANWHNLNSIQGGDINVYSQTESSRSDLLGTVYLRSTGDVSFEAVPEPSSALLLGLAALMGFVRRNRRK